LLEQSRDPETEDKVLQILNSENAPRTTAALLEGFLKNTKTQSHKDTNADNPWARLDRAYAANRRYLAAARLFDAGRKTKRLVRLTNS
jgi:hypothetical protein